MGVNPLLPLVGNRHDGARFTQEMGLDGKIDARRTEHAAACRQIFEERGAIGAVKRDVAVLSRAEPREAVGLHILPSARGPTNEIVRTPVGGVKDVVHTRCEPFAGFSPRTSSDTSGGRQR